MLVCFILTSDSTLLSYLPSWRRTRYKTLARFGKVPLTDDLVLSWLGVV